MSQSFFNNSESFNSYGRGGGGRELWDILYCKDHKKKTFQTSPHMVQSYIPVKALV